MPVYFQLQRLFLGVGAVCQRITHIQRQVEGLVSPLPFCFFNNRNLETSDHNRKILDFGDKWHLSLSLSKWVSLSFIHRCSPQPAAPRPGGCYFLSPSTKCPEKPRARIFDFWGLWTLLSIPYSPKSGSHLILQRWPAFPWQLVLSSARGSRRGSCPGSRWAPGSHIPGLGGLLHLWAATQPLSQLHRSQSCCPPGLIGFWVPTVLCSQDTPPWFLVYLATFSNFPVPQFLYLEET